MPPPPGTIQHLVVLMLENRSFDHMFGFLKSDQYPIEGLNGDEFNLDANNVQVTVSNDAMFSGDFSPDPGHDFVNVNVQIFGNADGTGAPSMGGFVQSYGQMGGSSVGQSHKIMKCYAPSKIPILTTLAQEYAVCDHWFSSVPGPTLPNRSYAHAATSIGRLDMNPIWFNEAKTIYELLAESNVSSKIFFHDATVAMTFKNFVANQNFFGSFDDFLDGCDSGKLPAYSFIEPRYNADDANNFAANDQHPDHDVAEGESLVHDVFNAISKKASLWNSTILLVVYDEHGGLYDHVPPPQDAPNPDNQNCQNPFFDFTRLGIRVPAVVISPWIDPLTIDSTRYEHASIAATARRLFLGDAWQTKFLNQRDLAANTFERNLTRDTARQDIPNFHTPVNVAALARARDPGQIAARAAQQAAQPLSDLQKTLVAQTDFVNQTLHPDVQSDTDPDDIKTEGQAAAFHNEVMSQVLPPKAKGTTP
jgi:phospholipase C